MQGCVKRAMCNINRTGVFWCFFILTSQAGNFLNRRLLKRDLLCNFFIFVLIQILYKKKLRKKSKLLLSYGYFLLSWYLTLGKEFTVYQTPSPFVLQVRGHNLNNREMYQFLQFYAHFKKRYALFKKSDVMQVS
jgi:hypothetical protein